MESFVLGVVLTTTKVEWRSATMERGEQCATMEDGWDIEHLMLKFSVSN